MIFPTAQPAVLADPIAEGILRQTFQSPADGKSETFLVKDFRHAGAPAVPLVVIYLHGALAHESQGMTAKIYGNAFGKWGEELARRGAVYLCPEYRGGSWMGPAAEADLLEIIGLTRERLAPCRIVLTGGSMGGTSALIFAGRHPRLIDGVVALCPASDVAEMFPAFPGQFLASYGGSPAEVPEEYMARCARLHARELASLPIVIVHGSADPLIPVHHSRIAVEKIRAAGGRLRYIEMEGGDHDAPIATPLKACLDFVFGDDSPGA